METKYDRDIYLKSLFEGNEVYYETFLPLKDEREITLLYKMDKIISVKNYEMNMEYEEGKDFILKDGKLVILEGSRIECMPLDTYYGFAPIKYDIRVSKDRCPYKFKEERYLYFGEQDEITRHQYAISYTHHDKWDGFVQKTQRDKLKRFYGKIAAKMPVNIVFYGDSISTGANSSGTVFGGNRPPYAESFPQMVVGKLRDKYKTQINMENVSLGGMDTRWGNDNIESRALSLNPDLLIIGFGMNDGNLEEEKHLALIKEMIDKAKASNPNIEIILIATSFPNPESTWYDGKQKEYINVYKTIEDDSIALCDITSIQKDILKRKKYKDMTGNNINHPNDFFARVYAQSILKVMGE
ncbi:MAG: SGNH/GDSL hydrolase family protein [Bacilli bacterium]|nr:SGNH/GDSL hydrolase family protein [Bacilli bacterium]